jgi:4-amino-4-deoxy-L-arabinose transferase-like glycosyltransferase
MKHKAKKPQNLIEQDQKENKETNKLDKLHSFFKVENIGNLNIDNPKIEHIILFVILFVAFLLRVIWLGDLPINEDEAYTLTTAKRLVTGENIANRLSTSLVYTYLQYFLFLIFGVSETVGRLPTAIFGTVSAYAMYLFCKKFINKRIAFLVLILVSFSFFEVFISRLARPYTLLQLSFIVLSWLLILIIKDSAKVGNGDNSFPNIFRLISIKHILLLFFLFLFSILVHSWAVLFWVTAIFYFFMMFFYMLFSKKYGIEKQIYLLFGITFILITILGWLLVVEMDLFKGMFQDRGAINVFSPNLSRIYNFLKDDPFVGVMHYLKLISYDFDYLWILGILGFFSSFFVIKDKKALLAIHSVLFSNLIILGFFIHVLQQRYFFQAYSFYLIYPAIGIFTICLLFLKFIKDKKYIKYREIIFGLIVVLILFISIPFTFFENMFTLKMYSNVYINDKFAEYTFYPYREACKYVKENIKPGEELICTMSRIAEFYIDRDVRDLRQVRLNTNNVSELIEDQTVYENSLANHPSFINFIQTHKSGWIILDPRAQTAVSKYTRDFIFYKMDVHTLGSVPIGLMFTVHWDGNTMSKHPRRFQLLRKQGPIIGIEINRSVFTDTNTIMKLTVVYSGVDKPDEALVVVGNEQDLLPMNLGLGTVDTADCYLRAAEFLRDGAIHFLYNTDCGDYHGGFFIYDVIITRHIDG